MSEENIKYTKYGKKVKKLKKEHQQTKFLKREKPVLHLAKEPHYRQKKVKDIENGVVCTECNGKMIVSVGYVVCEDCGLTVNEQIIEGTLRSKINKKEMVKDGEIDEMLIPKTLKGYLSVGRENEQLRYMRKFGASQEKIKRFEDLQFFLNRVDKLSNQQKQKIITNVMKLWNINWYYVKNMIFCAMKEILKQYYKFITLNYLIEKLPDPEKKKNRFINEITYKISRWTSSYENKLYNCNK